MALEIIESKFYECATFMFLNAVNWKDVQHRHYVRKNIRPPRQRCDIKSLFISVKVEGKLEATFYKWAQQEQVYCKYEQTSSKT